MRGSLLTAGLLTGVLATGLSAPVASAAESTTAPTTGTAPYLALAENTAAPGQELHFQGYCPDPDAGPLRSDVLTDLHMLHDPQAAAPNLNASGVIVEGTAPGTYRATMTCGSDVLRAAFTVVAPQPQPPAQRWLSVVPDQAHPGDTVTATAAGCGTQGVLSSPVLRTVTLRQNPEGHQPWAISGRTTVDSDASPGHHPVTVTCGQRRLATTITVLAGPKTGPSAGPTTSATPTAPSAPSAKGQVSRVPRGAPETGGGADTSGAGGATGTGGLAEHPVLSLLGGLLLGSAGATGAILWRRARP